VLRTLASCVYHVTYAPFRRSGVQPNPRTILSFAWLLWRPLSDLKMNAAPPVRASSAPTVVSRSSRVVPSPLTTAHAQAQRPVLRPSLASTMAPTSAPHRNVLTGDETHEAARASAAAVLKNPAARQGVSRWMQAASVTQKLSCPRCSKANDEADRACVKCGFRLKK
jgi:hypothetical protein